MLKLFISLDLLFYDRFKYLTVAYRFQVIEGYKYFWSSDSILSLVNISTDILCVFLLTLAIEISQMAS